MPVAKLTCPACQAVLKPSKPLNPGKKVKCPRCGAGFEVPGADTGVMAAKAMTPPEPAQPEAPPEPPVPVQLLSDDDEDTGPATYRFADEPEPAPKRHALDDYDDDDDDYEDDEDDDDPNKKADLSVIPDLTVKDPRGIAQEMLMRPSNYMMLFTVLDFIWTLIVMGYFLIPVFFSLPEDTSLPGPAPAQQAKETAKGTSTNALNVANWLFVLINAAVCTFLLVYDSLIIVGAVRIQNQESWGWGMAACILGIVPVATCGCFYIGRLIASIFTLITLRNPVVLEAFEYKPE
jgi:hypothetical protein